MGRRIDLTGRRFGALTCIRPSEPVRRWGRRIQVWATICDCGTEKDVYSLYLLSGDVTSCGCKWQEQKLQISVFTLKHGRTGTPEFNTYTGIRKRCTNKNAAGWRNYGGRGILMKYKDFAEFFQDVGRRPTPEHSIDRIDNNGHYEPGNCRWATRVAQASNTRTAKMVTYNNVTLTVSAWERRLGWKSDTLGSRLRRPGWTKEMAFEVPIK